MKGSIGFEIFGVGEAHNFKNFIHSIIRRGKSWSVSMIMSA